MMKKSLRLVNAAFLSFLLLFSAVEAHAFDIGKMLDFGKSTGNSTDIVEGLFGDSDLGQLYKAYTLEFSDEDAYYIGRAAAAAMLKKYSFYEDKELESYLNKICQTLVINSDEQIPYNGYHVKILDSDEINAFSTPGGHILITRGMISCADSEDSMAAIIAHEIAHVQLQHGLETIKEKRMGESGANMLQNTLSSLPGYKKTMQYITQISETTKSSLARAGFDESEIDMGIDLNNLSGFVVDYFVNGYSKEAEFAADERALSLMAAAGYSPSAMVTMLEKMQVTGEFKTHPKPKDRIAKVNKALKKLTVKDTQSYRKARFTKFSK